MGKTSEHDFLTDLPSRTSSNKTIHVNRYLAVPLFSMLYCLRNGSYFPQQLNRPTGNQLHPNSNRKTLVPEAESKIIFREAISKLVSHSQSLSEVPKLAKC